MKRARNNAQSITEEFVPGRSAPTEARHPDAEVSDPQAKRTYPGSAVHPSQVSAPQSRNQAGGGYPMLMLENRMENLHCCENSVIQREVAIVPREAGMAQRESAMAQREAAMAAQREALMFQREAAIFQRERELGLRMPQGSHLIQRSAAGHTLLSPGQVSSIPLVSVSRGSGEESRQIDRQPVQLDPMFSMFSSGIIETEEIDPRSNHLRK